MSNEKFSSGFLDLPPDRIVTLDFICERLKLSGNTAKSLKTETLNDGRRIVRKIGDSHLCIVGDFIEYLREQLE